MILTAVIFFVILTILVCIHELGHFAMARIIGVKVEEFGFGLPPRIFGKMFGKTLYSLNLLPIGGFVRLAGEDAEEDVGVKQKKIVSKKYFFNRSKKERVAILLAGVSMNLILALGITTALLTSGVSEPSGKVRVQNIQPKSPADTIGLRENDIIAKIQTNSEIVTVHVPKDVISTVKKNAGSSVDLFILRNGKELSLTVVPRVAPPPGEGPLGVAITDLEIHSYPIHLALIKSVEINAGRVRDMVLSIGSTIARVITLRSPEADIAGPIGIAKVTGEAMKFGWKAVLEFMSILSLNLAVLNALPIPALDGGRVLFVLFEKILGKRIRPAFERSTHQIGMIVLLALVALVSIGDIVRLFKSG
ncbi:site-2 protease family protein [Candidatus Gottesmanbacteria bacterium]|nr:site-2 protease family protein [Candidatus Gottesmanbacteria bacterium]